MKAEYLMLGDQHKIRIEINFNALSEWSALTGANLQQLKDLHANMKLLRALAWCGALEGEIIDGRELGMTEEEFGRSFGINEIGKVVKIIAGQLKMESSANKGADQEDDKKK